MAAEFGETLCVSDARFANVQGATQDHLERLIIAETLVDPSGAWRNKTIPRTIYLVCSPLPPLLQYINPPIHHSLTLSLNHSTITPSLHQSVHSARCCVLCRLMCGLRHVCRCVANSCLQALLTSSWGCGESHRCVKVHAHGLLST